MPALLLQLNEDVNAVLSDADLRRQLPPRVQLYLLAVSQWAEEAREDERVDRVLEVAGRRQEMVTTSVR